MSIRSIFVAGLLASSALSFPSALQAQSLTVESLPPQEIKLETPKETPLAPKATTPAPAPLPATTPIVSIPPSSCDSCGETACFSHPHLHALVYRIFHPFKSLHHGCGSCYASHCHWTLFHRFHHYAGCSSCGSSYSGAYAYNPGVSYSSGMYAYYPAATPTYAVQNLAQQPSRAASIITPAKLAEWKQLSTGTLYSRALGNYWDGDYRAALEMFWILVETDGSDSRYWYFKALTERSMGDLTAANDSARRGAALEVVDRNQALLVPDALERVQGLDRQFLRAPGAEIKNVAAAQTIVSQPLPKRNSGAVTLVATK